MLINKYFPFRDPFSNDNATYKHSFIHSFASLAFMTFFSFLFVVILLFCYLLVCSKNIISLMLIFKEIGNVDDKSDRKIRNIRRSRYKL